MRLAASNDLRAILDVGIGAIDGLAKRIRAISQLTCFQAWVFLLSFLVDLEDVDHEFVLIRLRKALLS